MNAKNTKILVIDDSKTVRKTAAVMLAAAGYSSVEFSNDGLSGLNDAFRIRPDVILIDVMMPKIDGHTLCSMLRAQDWASRSKIVMLTGKETVLDLAKTRVCGADSFVGKPFSSTALLASVSLSANTTTQCQEQ